MPTGIYQHKPLSKKHKRKLSLAMIGRISHLRGKKRPPFSEEWKEKIGIGVIKTCASRNFIRKRRDERNDSLYQWWSNKVKKRDGNQCAFKSYKCFGYNIVHHILPWRDFPELRYNINNGITLCQAHHPLKRAEEKRLIPFFSGLVQVSNESIK